MSLPKHLNTWACGGDSYSNHYSCLHVVFNTFLILSSALVFFLLPWPKTSWEGKVTVHNQMSSGLGNLRSNLAPRLETWSNNAYWLVPMNYLFAHFTSQDYLAKHGTSHSGLDSPTSIINQQNALDWHSYRPIWSKSSSTEVPSSKTNSSLGQVEKN